MTQVKYAAGQAGPGRSQLFGPGLLRKTVLFVSGIAGVSLLVGLGVSVKLARSAGWDGAAVARWLPWLLLLGSGSYLLRFVRWHCLVRQLAPRSMAENTSRLAAAPMQAPLRSAAHTPGLRLGTSLGIYLAGFAMGLTPGRLGEFCKFTLLRQETGVPEIESAPIFPLERATEAASFAALATAGAVLGHFAPAKLGVSTLAAILAVPGLAILALALRLVTRRSAPRQDSPSHEAALRRLGRGVQAVAGPWPLAQALLCAAGARCCDAALFWSATQAAGLHLSLPGSALAFGIAGLTGGFSLLPAGVGAVEASLVATVSGLGGDPAAALVAALLARCVTLWMWVPAGLFFAVRASAPQGLAESHSVDRSDGQIAAAGRSAVAS
jgi:uncharacterized membrane protein YbhN (UPF0104 family)